MWAIRWVEGLSAGGLWEGFLVEVNIVLAVGASAGVARGGRIVVELVLAPRWEWASEILSGGRGSESGLG